MDNQRLFLGLALAFVVFLIWQTWTEEQARLRAPAPAARTEAAPAVPADPSSPPRAAQDIPVAASPTGLVPSVGRSLETSGRISVITDQYEAEIDTTGGDLRILRLREYPVSIHEPGTPYTLLNDGEDLFAMQSGLVTEGDLPSPTHHAQYRAEQSEYRLAEGQDLLEVPLVWEEDGVRVTKVYQFHRDSFQVEVEHWVENATGAPWAGAQYRQIQRRPPEEGDTRFIYTYTGGVISSPEKRYEKISFDDMEEEPLARTIQGGWAAMIQHYFAAAWIPDPDETDNYYTRKLDGQRYVLGLTGPLARIADGETSVYRSGIYAGPKIQKDLEAAAPGLELTVDYGYLTIIAQPLFWLLQYIHGVVGNWGWSIIILTIMIKAVFFKLSETSYRSMANMRRMQPRIQALREKFAHDKQKMNQAMMDLYKKEKINPMGGCLPIVVQIPVFIALYWMLLESVELRQAPFIFWIEDLSTKDPFYVLPVLMGISMFIQQRLNPAPPDPIQAKVMMALPLVFTVFFLWFPSGLVVYWLVNNILSIAQQWVITRRVEAQGS